MIVFMVVIVSGVVGLALQQYLPRLMYELIPTETIYGQIETVTERYAEEAKALVTAACGELKFPDQPQPKLAATATKPAQEPAATTDYKLFEETAAVGLWQGKVLQTRRINIELLPNPAPLHDEFVNEIHPYLNGEKPHSRLAAENRAALAFEELRLKLLPSNADPVLTQLAAMCGQRRQIDLQARLHGMLHFWLLIHLPLSIFLIFLMCIHIVTALRYV
jgi:hypothetical protein